MKKLLVAGMLAPILAQAYDSPTNVLTGASEGFDMASTFGIGILTFLVVLGVVMTGIRTYRGRGK